MKEGSPITSRDFCYWFQGFLEISGAIALSADQIAVVRNHLSMVFVHEIDPSMGGPEHQQKLSETHTPGTFGTRPPVMKC